MSTPSRSAQQSQVSLESGRWTIDPTRSRAEFRVKHTWGLATVVGTLNVTDGSLEVDSQRRLQMHLVLDAGSVSSGNRMRDKDLRTDKFFHVERYPTVEFRSSSAEMGDAGLQVTGELSAGGHRLVISPATILELDGEELTIDASATVDQRELGMTHSPLGMVRTPARLRVAARLRRAQ